MTEINLGTNCEINLEKLIGTRLLITANSGGGKSWAIRKLLEESHGKLQQIIFDLEGEFSTLKEKYDYTLFGNSSGLPLTEEMSHTLPQKLLQLNINTILDLSELKHHERLSFVKNFLDNLIDSPQNLWHPVLVIVDEAHQFCPEKRKSESANSVIDLMTRGRKRGFCGVLATQRISKLHKDAVAEANNYMIGRISLDIDLKRAMQILGFTRQKDLKYLRALDVGGFYGFGSAFKSPEVQYMAVGDVNTTHKDLTNDINIKASSKAPENIEELLEPKKFKRKDPMKKLRSSIVKLLKETPMLNYEEIRSKLHEEEVNLSQALSDLIWDTSINVYSKKKGVGRRTILYYIEDEENHE